MSRVHRHTVRVRFPEVDLMGWAHHTVYFVWFEIGRTELMRSLSLAYDQVLKRGFHLPVVEAHCRYRAPARYDQTVLIETRVTQVSPILVQFDYRILDPDQETVLAEGYTRHAVVNAEGKVRKLPLDFLDVLRRAQDTPAVSEPPAGPETLPRPAGV